MKVFIFDCNKQYGGGLAVVAANDKEEAFELIKEEYGGDEWIYEYTDLDHCHERLDIEANVIKPQVLEADFYIE